MGEVLMRTIASPHTIRSDTLSFALPEKGA